MFNCLLPAVRVCVCVCNTKSPPKQRYCRYSLFFPFIHFVSYARSFRSCCVAYTQHQQQRHQAHKHGHLNQFFFSMFNTGSLLSLFRMIVKRTPNGSKHRVVHIVHFDGQKRMCASALVQHTQRTRSPINGKCVAWRVSTACVG